MLGEEEGSELFFPGGIGNFRCAALYADHDRVVEVGLFVAAAVDEHGDPLVGAQVAELMRLPRGNEENMLQVPCLRERHEAGVGAVLLLAGNNGQPLRLQQSADIR